MRLKMFDSLLSYFGGKRKLCPIIFRYISKYLPRKKWQNKIFIDAFLGSETVSLFAKSQGFKILCNDIAERSFIAGKALIKNNQTFLTDADLIRLFVSVPEHNHLIEKEFVPDVFTEMHAKFLDSAFTVARSPLDKYLLLKYVFHIRPYSKFSSPNAFNRPMSD